MSERGDYWDCDDACAPIVLEWKLGVLLLKSV